METFSKTQGVYTLLICIFALVLAYWLEHQRNNSWTSKLPSDLSLPDAYSSVYLIELAEIENLVHEALLELAKNQSHLLTPTILKQIHEYLSEYEDGGGKLNLEAEALSNDTTLELPENPLLTLNLITRFTQNLRRIYDELQIEANSSTNGIASTFLDSYPPSENWPNQTVLEEAIESFFRIQMVYDLDAEDLAIGKISGHETKARLSILTIFMLGKYARKFRMHSLAVPWLELTLERLHSVEKANQVTPNSIDEVETALLETMMEHDMEWPERLLISSRGKEYYFQEKLLDAEQRPIEKRLSSRKMNLEDLKTMGLKYKRIKSWKICSGENFQTEKEKSKLHCWYQTTSLRIYPIKMELLSRTPHLVQIYDALSSNFITRLELANPRLLEYRRSQVGFQDHVGFVTKSRTSLNIIGEHDLAELSKLMETITGLNVLPETSAELLQIVRYGPGGHYDCHLDIINAVHLTPTSDNRIATLMFYLEDVIAGGFTAFPEAGIAARPIKGSALLWYNLKPDGEIDFDTHHCACPVILGSKTIATKWIRHNDQFRRRPCELHQNDND